MNKMNIQNILHNNYEKHLNTVKSMLERKESCMENSMNFIITFTDLADAIINYDNSALNANINKLYLFNEEGISKLQNDINTKNLEIIIDNGSDNRKTIQYNDITKSDFYRKKANIANIESTYSSLLDKKYDFGTKAYNNYIAAAQLIGILNSKVAFQDYMKAIEITSKLLKVMDNYNNPSNYIKKRVKDLRKDQYNIYKKAILVNNISKNSIDLLTKTGDSGLKLFKLEKSQELKEEIIKHFETAKDYIDKYNHENSRNNLRYLNDMIDYVSTLQLK